MGSGAGVDVAVAVDGGTDEVEAALLSSRVLALLIVDVRDALLALPGERAGDGGSC